MVIYMRKKKLVNALCALCMPLVLSFASCSKPEPVFYKTSAWAWDDASRQTLSIAEEAFHYSGTNVQNCLHEDGTESVYVFSSHLEQPGGLMDTQTGWLHQGAYFTKSLPAVWSSDSPIEVQGEGKWVRLYPADGTEHAGEKQTVTDAFGVQREAVVYPSALDDGADYICIPTAYGLNTEIRLSKAGESTGFSVKVQTANLVPDTGSPDYILLKTALENGNVNTILYTPLAVDKNGSWSYGSRVQLTDKDSETGTYTVQYTPDAAFLQDAAYPVRLNQSIYLYKSKQPDTSAYSDTGDEAGHYLSPYMLLGDSTPKGEGWTFVRFETLNALDIDPQRIVSATYTVHNLFDLPKEAVVGAYAVTADWCSINTRWFNRPPFDKTPVSQVKIQAKGDYTLDVTSLLREMLKNKPYENAAYSVQNSFFIRCDSAGDSLLLASGDNGLFSPFLEIVLKE